MKTALILHGTDFSLTRNQRKNNWFPWLKKELEALRYEVLLPELPQADQPDIKRYWKFLTDKFDFNQESILIGHSSGAAAILGILNLLPTSKPIDKAILVAGFLHDRGWNCEGLFTEELKWPKIKNQAQSIHIIHSDNDPYVPLSDAQELSQHLNTKVILKKGQKHFSVGTMGEKYRQFPELLELISNNE